MVPYIYTLTLAAEEEGGNIIGYAFPKALPYAHKAGARLGQGWSKAGARLRL